MHRFARTIEIAVAIDEPLIAIGIVRRHTRINRSPAQAARLQFKNGIVLPTFNQGHMGHAQGLVKTLEMGDAVSIGRSLCQKLILLRKNLDSSP